MEIETVEAIQKYDLDTYFESPIAIKADDGDYIKVDDLKAAIEKEKMRISKEIHDTKNENSIMVLSGMRSSLDNLLSAIV